MKHPGRTPPYRGPHGTPVPGSIAEIAYLPLGGLDQWMMIRGESAANPPLILLHGGPGMSETSFFRHCNAALENSFTVVYWDQRAAGKSFDSRIPRATMTVERFLSDLDELVTYVCKRVDTSKGGDLRPFVGLSARRALRCTIPAESRGVRWQRTVWRLVSSRSRIGDHWVPPETSAAYFDALTAPFKKLVWFEKSGHEPFVDEPAKFNAAMVDLVRPSLGGG